MGCVTHGDIALALDYFVLPFQGEFCWLVGGNPGRRFTCPGLFCFAPSGRVVGMLVAVTQGGVSHLPWAILFCPFRALSGRQWAAFHW